MSDKSPFREVIDSMTVLDRFKGPEPTRWDRFGGHSRELGKKFLSLVKQSAPIVVLLVLGMALAYDFFKDTTWVEFIVAYLLISWAVVWLVVKLAVKGGDE